MKYIKAIPSIALLIMVSTIANAESITLPPAKKSPNLPIILKIQAISSNTYISSYSDQTYTGTSTKAPCTDLQLFTNDYHWVGTVNGLTQNLSSLDLVQKYGQRITCLEEDIVWDEKIYSTGKIQLLWDENSRTYTAATPNKATIDFNTETPATE
ncbi:MAG: hypothetical protein V4501_03695 [Pseudomonadota bacterium]